jgi:glyoxylase-like metal-dependent hydrolase (beta-lactamase superfamily II)
MSDLLCNPFCDPNMLTKLERTFVKEIAPDVVEIEGFCPTMFFLEPPSGNIFVMRDGDMVVLMDTGHHGFYRPRILDSLKKFRKEGAKELVLVMSHGHWDHGKNNDVIYEAGYEKVRFLLPENEFHTLDIQKHMTGDMAKAFDYYDPCAGMAEGFKMMLEWNKQFPEFNDPKYQDTWAKMKALPAEYDGKKTYEVYKSLLLNVLCPDLRSYIIDRAEPLLLSKRVKRKYGHTVVHGWPLGRFFLIHDASQSPGHICIYDPLNKFIITGDATLEINPPFLDTDFGNCIESVRACLQMVEDGYITLATDSHRTAQWGKSFELWGMKPLEPVQLVDVARGKDECKAHFSMFLEYYTAMWDETIKAHAAIGEATVSEILAQLAKSTNKYVVFKLGLKPPAIPIRPENLIALVLKETGAGRRVVKDRILFTPVV